MTKPAGLVHLLFLFTCESLLRRFRGADDVNDLSRDLPNRISRCALLTPIDEPVTVDLSIGNGRLFYDHRLNSASDRQKNRPAPRRTVNSYFVDERSFL